MTRTSKPPNARPRGKYKGKGKGKGKHVEETPVGRPRQRPVVEEVDLAVPSGARTSPAGTATTTTTTSPGMPASSDASGGTTSKGSARTSCVTSSAWQTIGKSTHASG